MAKDWDSYFKSAYGKKVITAFGERALARDFVDYRSKFPEEKKLIPFLKATFGIDFAPELDPDEVYEDEKQTASGKKKVYRRRSDLTQISPTNGTWVQKWQMSPASCEELALLSFYVANTDKPNANRALNICYMQRRTAYTRLPTVKKAKKFLIESRSNFFMKLSPEQKAIELMRTLFSKKPKNYTPEPELIEGKAQKVRVK